MAEPSLRDATASDLAVVQTIYAHHVCHGLASFEEAPPDLSEIRRRYTRIIDSGLPYLVAEWDGRVQGYAYASSFRPRPAYRYTVEDTVYVAPESVGQGAGGALLDELIRRCTAGGLRRMVAVIGDSDNLASIRIARKGRIPPRRHLAVGRLQVRALGRFGAARAAAGAGRQPPALTWHAPCVTAAARRLP